MKNLYIFFISIIFIAPTLLYGGDLRPTFEVDKPKVCLTPSATSESITFTNTTQEALWTGTITYTWKFINTTVKDTILKNGPGPFTISMTEGDWLVRLDAIDEETPEKNKGFSTQNVYIGRQKKIVIGAVPFGCEGSEVIVDGGSGFEKYTWLRGKDTVGVAQKLKTTSSGEYQLHAISFAGCASKDVVTVKLSLCTALEEGSIDKRFISGPNPTSDILKVNVALPQSSSLKLSLINLMGIISHSETFDSNKQFEKEIDVSGLAKGVYYLQYQLDGKIAKSEKIIVR